MVEQNRPFKKQQQKFQNEFCIWNVRFIECFSDGKSQKSKKKKQKKRKSEKAAAENKPEENSAAEKNAPEMDEKTAEDLREGRQSQSYIR